MISGLSITDSAHSLPTPPGSIDLRRNLVLEPADGMALHHYGLACHGMGHPGAFGWFSRSVAAEPLSPLFHYAKAVAAAGGKGVRSLRRAVALLPGFLEAFLELAAPDTEQGVYLSRAVALDPSHPGAICNLAAWLLGVGDTGTAVSRLDHALKHHPHEAVLWINRGRAAEMQGETAFAVNCGRRAVALDPQRSQAWLNLSSLAYETDRLSEAITAATRTLAIIPGHLQARWNLMNARLAAGDWQGGFSDFDVRLAIQRAYPHLLEKPRWTGERFSGRLLVHDEIGYGDVFNFLRYLPLAKARVGEVVFEVKPGLARLLSGYPGIDRLIERGPAPPDPSTYDLFVPLESLPAVFGTTVDRVPPPEPPLQAPGDLAGLWKRRLGGTGLKVGLVWAGNPASGFDRSRSCRLSDLEPILSIPGISFVSLQKGQAEDEIGRLESAASILATGRDLVDFADTAAAIANLDLVISVETSVAHLVGIMQRPLWVLLAPNTAWRWLRHRTDTPWYPTARLFRRHEKETWRDCATAVAAALRARFA